VSWTHILARLGSGKLWLLLGGLVAVHHLTVMSLTQAAASSLLAMMVWGGALICMEDRLPGLRPAPSRLSIVLGTVLVLWGLWRGAQVAYLDAVTFVLPLVLGLGLALLCVPVRRLGEFRVELAVLALMFVALLILHFMPEKALSEATAEITYWILLALGQDAQVQGRLVALPRGGVYVAGSCNGVEVVAQLLVIAVVFLLAFRMKSPARMLAILVLAPIFAILGNALRITLLALVVDSDWAWKSEIFKFFHDEYGALVFSGITVGSYGWAYLVILEGDLAARKKRAQALAGSL
jgi:cyanoexosortase A